MEKMERESLPPSVGIRKSTRVRTLKLKQQTSDTCDETTMTMNVNKLPTKTKLRKRNQRFSPNSSAREQSFCCDICKSSSVINPLRKTGKNIKKKQTPRHKVDPNTKKMLTLCNACGLAANHAFEPREVKPKALVSLDEKEKYLEDAKAFASLLAKTLNDSNANNLYCSRFKGQGCGCLQNFINTDDDFEEAKKRANHLLQLMNEAKQLSQQKCYDKTVVSSKIAIRSSSSGKSRKCRGSIGLGNGQKKSRQFEEFVLRNRQHLREELKLCERATQSVLIYSNNFLHKRMKTEPSRGPRVQRRKGKAALGLLIPIDQLPLHQCCAAKCVQMASSFVNLLDQWRSRANLGQLEARRVLAEMLIPCGGARSNCYRFISMVTGCSQSTICSVSEQMKRTGGDREPPEHGLKRWWKSHPRAAKPLGDQEADELIENENEIENETSAVAQAQPTNEDFCLSSDMNTSIDGQMESSTLSLNSSDTALQLQLTRQQLYQLQRQVTQQQLQIQQQQQIIEQQILTPQILQNNKDAALNSEQLLQRMFVDCLPESSSGSCKNVDMNHQLAHHNLFAEYSASISPGVNITIFQPAVNDGDVNNDQLASQTITTSAFENVVLIDPLPIVVSNANESEAQSTANLYSSVSSGWNDT